MNSRRHLALAIILLVALGLRAGWAERLSPDMASLNGLPDQQEYLALGRNLLRGQGLQFTDPRFNQRVWAYRTPGYPLLIAACGGSVRAVRNVQILLDVSTVVAIYLIARRYLSANWSLAAAGAVAVNPLLIYFSGLILSETLFTAMLAWGMCLLLLANRNRYVFLAGITILSLSVLVRPSALLLPAFLTLIATRRHAIAWAIAAVALTLLILFPWAYRNHLRLGDWIWTSTNAGITSYDGFNPAANGGSDQSFLRNMPQVAQMGEIQRSDYFHHLADQFIREHPAACVKITILKIARFWSPLPWSSEFSQPLYIAAGLLYTLPLLALTLLGLFTPTIYVHPIRQSHFPLSPSPCTQGEGRGGGLPVIPTQIADQKNPSPYPSPGVPREGTSDRNDNKLPKSFLFLPALYFTIIHAASVSSLRYRIPAEPPMTIVAIAGAQWWVCRKGQ